MSQNVLDAKRRTFLKSCKKKSETWNFLRFFFFACYFYIVYKNVKKKYNLCCILLFSFFFLLSVTAIIHLFISPFYFILRLPSPHIHIFIHIFYSLLYFNIFPFFSFFQSLLFIYFTILFHFESSFLLSITFTFFFLFTVYLNLHSGAFVKSSSISTATSQIIRIFLAPFNRPSSRGSVLTELYILVVGHDEDDVGAYVTAVTLHPSPEALTPCGGGRVGQRSGQGEDQQPCQARRLHDGRE